MKKWWLAGATTLLTMLVIDAAWIGWLARPLYEQGIGHLMADTPRLGAAAAFYLVYAAGLTWFAVRPHAATPGAGRSAATGALFGLVAYATYDLTNLATLKDWPVGLALLDLAWGGLVSAAAASAGKAAFDRIAHR